MPEVANPAIIIGLGGTGKWVLTYVKKNLLDTYGGRIPPTVKLLSFDTTSEKVSREGIAQEEDARVGDVQLDKNAEFVYLGGNIQDITRDIRDRKAYPHIGSWLQARTYLQMSDADAFDIARGAGQKRPFGRMAIFYNLQKSVQAEITNKITTAISDVIAANQRESGVEIYIVASLAGGTGAGMFIDMAHLARWFAERHIRTGYAIRGFLALHNTFKSVIKTEQVQANAFAAMRELDRFMLVFDQQYPIVYNPSNPVLNTIYGGRLGKLFDNCYLLDASRENLPLDAYPPKYGVYPSMADCISMLLDASTGDAYAQHYKNVNTRIADVQSQLKQPLYSSLGTYSLVLPVEDIITSLNYRFAIDLLSQHLLSLEQHTNSAGQIQNVLRYDGDARQDAAAFLRASRSVSGIESTNFIQRVPLTVDSRNLQSEAYIAETANLDEAELLTWILPPETDPAVQEITRKVRGDLEMRLSTRVLPSDIEGDKPIEGCDRIARGVRDFKEGYLGRDIGGRRTGGAYRIALETCIDLHSERYRTLLQEHLLILLNGPAPENKDYQREKRGKLGQAQALLANLALYFNEQAAFLERIKARRAKTDELRSAQENAGLARAEMEDAKTRTTWVDMFTDKLNPGIKAQKAYIQAEQDLIEVEINELFFDFLQRASELLRTITEEYKATIDAWVNTLVQGLSGSINDPGLYRALQESAAQHQANRDDKDRIEVHEYVTDAQYEDQLYKRCTDGKFGEAMTRLIWGAEQRANSFQLTLNGCSIIGTGPAGGRTATERNTDFFLSIARGYFEPLHELTIADRLVERDPLRLATMLLDKCGPMVRYDTSKVGGAQELHYFVCVDEGRQKGYFNELRDALRRLGASAKDNQVLDSSNPYTCTILATADVIASQGLQAYVSAEREYNSYLGDARLLHIFPAEVNAVQLEQQLVKIHEPRRRFSHVLTAMLEDRKIVEQFILAYLYRFIRLEKAEGINSSWILFLTTTQRRGGNRFNLTTSERQPSLFQAMETFVFRKTDITNTAQPINYEALEQELRRYEDLRTEGNASRLINLLEAAIDRDIEPLRRDPDPAQRDLGSLMRLVVDEIIEGQHNLLKASGEQYDQNVQPMPDLREARGEPAVPVEPIADNRSGLNTAGNGLGLNGKDTQTASDSPTTMTVVSPGGSQDSFKMRLKELKDLRDDGLLEEEEYQSLRKEILDQMRRV